MVKLKFRSCFIQHRDIRVLGVLGSARFFKDFLCLELRLIMLKINLVDYLPSILEFIKRQII